MSGSSVLLDLTRWFLCSSVIKYRAVISRFSGNAGAVLFMSMFAPGEKRDFGTSFPVIKCCISVEGLINGELFSITVNLNRNGLQYMHYFFCLISDRMRPGFT